MPAEMYLLAGGIGFIFGSLVAFVNMCITRRGLQKNSANAVMAASLLRMLVNIAALAAVYFTRKLLPLPFYGTIIGHGRGLVAGGDTAESEIEQKTIAGPNEESRVNRR